MRPPRAKWPFVRLSLSPHEVEAGRLIEQLGGVGEQRAGVVGEGGEEASAAGWLCDGGLAGDAVLARGINERDAVPADLVDEAEFGIDGFLAGPDLAGSERTDFIVGGVTADGDVMDELAVHVVDEALEIGLLLGRHVACRIAGVLERAVMDDDALEL